MCAGKRAGMRVDRISGLDDFVLEHILSFLSTKESVCTSVLSKRWVSLWKSVPRLDLWDNLFGSNNQKLVNFGNSFFEHHPGVLDEFTLVMNCEEQEYEPIISAWVRKLVTLKPREVNLQLHQFYKGGGGGGCSQLLNCVTIEKMRIDLVPPYWHHISFWSINPSDVNLPFLKKLEVRYMYMNDELILGCPSIEEMNLTDCVLNLTKRMRSSSLKTLRMSNVVLTVNARLPVFENLESLYILDFETNKDFEPLASFLKCTPNLKELTFLKVKLPKGVKIQLDKVEHLDIGYFEINEDFEPLASYLKCTPNVQKLTLRHVKFEKLRISVEAIRFDRLKTVEIDCCEGDQGACILKNYFINRVNSIQIYHQPYGFCNWCDFDRRPELSAPF